MKGKYLVLTAFCIEGATILLWFVFPDRFAGAPLWIPDLLVRAFFATFTGTFSGILCLLQGDVFGACSMFHQEQSLLIGVLVSAIALLMVRKLNSLVSTKPSRKTAKLTCPKCQSIHFLVYKHERNAYPTTKIVPRITTRRYNADGEYIGHEEEDVEVPGTAYYSAYFMKCNSCGHTWKSDLDPGPEYHK